jgi:DNA-binding NtrC family response regulator
MIESDSGRDQHCFVGMTALCHSGRMQAVFQRAERAAATQAAVLITGESGSGKELVARAVHHYSLRASRPWVDVNCGALPDALMESELFGHEKGAFSSADSQKPGLFELAHSGTLFLDEVGELDPRMQVKLLRVLDGVPYYRVGGTKKVAVDVRIVAATNRDLKADTAHGRFRSDLYHRLCQIVLEVPPLRARPEDVAPLAAHFLEAVAPRLTLTTEALDLLRGYSWPGNVRELRNVIHAAAAMVEGFEIRPADLPPEIQVVEMKPPAPKPEVRVTEEADLDGPVNLDEMEFAAIRGALSRASGHHQRAADLLGISRRTLSRKLKRYGPSLTWTERSTSLLTQ